MRGRLLKISNLRSLSLCLHVLAWALVPRYAGVPAPTPGFPRKTRRILGNRRAGGRIHKPLHGTPSKRLRLASGTSERVFNLIRRESLLNRRSSEFGRPNALVIVLRSVHARTDRPSESLGGPLVYKPEEIFVAAFVQFESASLQIQS